MTKTVHERKLDVLQVVNNIYAQHGEGLNLEIKISYLIIQVRLIDFNKGVNVKSESFKVDLQESMVRRCATDRMQKSLLRLGKKFLPVNAWDHKKEC